MTTIVVLLLGAGVLFIASALDNSSLQQTFQKIINDQPIDWSGTGATLEAGTTPQQKGAHP